MEGRLNESIVGEIRAAIRSKLSNRHVPAKIINCDKIPYTTNGKRLEVSQPSVLGRGDRREALYRSLTLLCLIPAPHPAPQIPVKKLINGIPYEKLNLSSAEDPQYLRYFVDHPELKLPGKAKL
jgi:acetoacetyl-CoA synthetase